MADVGMAVGDHDDHNNKKKNDPLKGTNPGKGQKKHHLSFTGLRSHLHLPHKKAHDHKAPKNPKPHKHNFLHNPFHKHHP